MNAAASLQIKRAIAIAGARTHAHAHAHGADLSLHAADTIVTVPGRTGPRSPSAALGPLRS